jgi:arylsulfatase A-like enzyme
MHYFDVHAPYRPPKSFSKNFLKDGVYETGKHLPILPMESWNSGGLPDFIAEKNITSLDYYIAQYDGAIRFVDAQIGRLLNYLKKENLSENTILIMTADHGEYLGEHNFMSHTGFPLEVVMKVPLIMKHGDLFKQKRIDFQTQSIDIAPTILDILGIKKAETMQGKSLLPLIQNGNAEYASYVFLGGEAISAVRGEGYKLIRINLGVINKVRENGKKAIKVPWYIDNDGNKIKYLLFDLEKDPKESTDLMATHARLGDSLKEKLEGWLLNSGYEFGRSNLSSGCGTDPEYLKSLGYA